MRKTIKVITVLLTFALALSVLASCKLFEDEKEPTKSEAVASGSGTAETTNFKAAYTDKELNTAVIKIGERTVTMDEYLDFFQEIHSYYKSNYNMDITETNETLTQYLDMITETLIKDTMVLYQADELGLTKFTDEQKAEIKENFENEKADMKEYYEDYAKSEAGESATAEDIDAKIDAYMLDEAAYYCGEGTTLDEYYDYLYEQEEKEYIKDLLFDEITKDVEVSEDDVKDWYEDASEDDEEYFKESPETYKDECDSYESTGYISDGKTAVSPLYVPEGYSRILDILIASEGDVSETYTGNQESMTSLSTEYGKLAFDNAANGTTVANTNRMKEIMNEYNELKDANDKELTKLHKDAKKDIDKAYKALEDGESFAKVMTKYTQDTNFKKDGEFAEKGRLISTDYTSATDWSSTIKKEFSKLDVGEYSKVFLDSDGYHIIFRISDEKSGMRTLSEAKAEIEANLITTDKQTAYDEKITAWCDEGKNVVRNDKLIESLCK